MSPLNEESATIILSTDTVKYKHSKHFQESIFYSKEIHKHQFYYDTNTLICSKVHVESTAALEYENVDIIELVSHNIHILLTTTKADTMYILQLYTVIFYFTKNVRKINKK